MAGPRIGRCTNAIRPYRTFATPGLTARGSAAASRGARRRRVTRRRRRPSSSRQRQVRALGRGEVPQDEVGGVHPPRRAADADPDPQVVLGAERRADRAQAVVAALAAAPLEPDVAGGMSSSSWMTTRRSRVDLEEPQERRRPARRTRSCTSSGRPARPRARDAPGRIRAAPRRRTARRPWALNVGPARRAAERARRRPSRRRCAGCRHIRVRGCRARRPARARCCHVTRLVGCSGVGRGGTRRRRRSAPPRLLALRGTPRQPPRPRPASASDSSCSMPASASASASSASSASAESAASTLTTSSLGVGDERRALGQRRAPRRGSACRPRGPRRRRRRARGCWWPATSSCDGLRVQGDDGLGSGLALDVDRDVDGDLLAAADDDEVDVLDDRLDRVALHVLGQGQLLVAVDRRW